MVAFSALSSMAQDFGGLLDVGTVAPDLVNEKGNVLIRKQSWPLCGAILLGVMVPELQERHGQDERTLCYV